MHWHNKPFSKQQCCLSEIDHIILKLNHMIICKNTLLQCGERKRKPKTSKYCYLFCRMENNNYCIVAMATMFYKFIYKKTHCCITFLWKLLHNLMSIKHILNSNIFVGAFFPTKTSSKSYKQLKFKTVKPKPFFEKVKKLNA